MERKRSDVLSLEKKIDHVEIIDFEKELRVLASITGASKEEIRLGATKRMLKIRVSHEIEHVHLPYDVNPYSAKATYKNGVLEVIFSK
jgi:HSP20 family protein